MTVTTAISAFIGVLGVGVFAYLLGYLHRSGAAIPGDVAVDSLKEIAPSVAKELNDLAWRSDVPHAVRAAATRLLVSVERLQNYSPPGMMPWEKSTPADDTLQINGVTKP